MDFFRMLSNLIFHVLANTPDSADKNYVVINAYYI